MTDRELLERAARAAGIAGTFEDWPGFEVRYGMPCAIYIDGEGHWNPLEDDGDALRLAVRLGIQIGDFGQYGRALVICGGVEFWELGVDPYAATRRAIVRAAASMVEDA